MLEKIKTLIKDALLVLTITCIVTVVVAIAGFITTVAAAVVAYSKMLLETAVCPRVALITFIITSIIIIIRRVVKARALD